MVLTPQLQSLIEKTDNRELVRDQIAAILKVEATQQEAYAVTASMDPKLWKLRVFTERAEPWALVTDDNHAPIVNVKADSSTWDKSASNLIERQTYLGTFHIDCLGFGFAEAKATGHSVADKMAVQEAERAARLCRNILMSSYYTCLGFPQQKYLPSGQHQVVSERYISKVTSMQADQGTNSLERVAAVRLHLEVRYCEFSPQYQGVPLEILALTCTRSDDGEWFSAEYDLT